MCCEPDQARSTFCHQTFLLSEDDWTRRSLAARDSPRQTTPLGPTALLHHLATVSSTVPYCHIQTAVNHQRPVRAWIHRGLQHNTARDKRRQCMVNLTRTRYYSVPKRHTLAPPLSWRDQIEAISGLPFPHRISSTQPASRGGKSATHLAALMKWSLLPALHRTLCGK